MIDLLIPGQSPGIKEKLVDLYGKPELLFFGPDGTSLNHWRVSCDLTCLQRVLPTSWTGRLVSILRLSASFIVADPLE